MKKKGDKSAATTKQPLSKSERDELAAIDEDHRKLRIDVEKTSFESYSKFI